MSSFHTFKSQKSPRSNEILYYIQLRQCLPERELFKQGSYSCKIPTDLVLSYLYCIRSLEKVIALEGKWEEDDETHKEGGKPQIILSKPYCRNMLNKLFWRVNRNTLPSVGNHRKCWNHLKNVQGISHQLTSKYQMLLWFSKLYPQKHFQIWRIPALRPWLPHLSPPNASQNAMLCEQEPFHQR